MYLYFTKLLKTPTTDKFGKSDCKCNKYGFHTPEAKFSFSAMKLDEFDIQINIIYKLINSQNISKISLQSKINENNF